MFNRRHLLGFLIAFFIASHLNSLTVAQLPTVKELSDGVDRRHATYRDLKFVYDVRYKTEISPTPPPAIDTSGGFAYARDVFKFAGGTSMEKPEKWNSSWVRTSNKGFGQQAMTDFYVTDDDIQYSFTRWNSNIIGAIRGQHEGSVQPRSYGSYYSENPFKNFLFLRFNNIPILEISPGHLDFDVLKNHLMDKFVVERERVVAGRTIYTLRASINPDDEFHWIELEMSGAPEFLIYRWEVFYQKQPWAVFRIDDYAKVGSVIYPSKGFFEHKPVKSFFGFTYVFDVTYAGPLSAEDRQAWIPKWPPNTLVQNPIEARQFVTRREFPPISPSVRRAIIMLFGCLAACAVVLGLWFSWSTKSFELRLLVMLIGLGVPVALLAQFTDKELAATFVKLAFLSTILAIPMRTICGTSLRHRGSGTTPLDSTQVDVSRVGFREWSMFVAALLVTALLNFKLDVPMEEKVSGIIYEVISFLVLSVLFHRILSPRADWAVLAFLSIGAALFLFLQVPVLALFDIPYFGKDHSAWVMLHVAGFVTLSILAVSFRLSNWRIGSDWKLPKSRRFSTREVGLWTASLAVLLALTQYLIKPDL